ncbi:MAG: hypothetical protein AABZ15_06430 [Nitrospirota bacterium]
MKRIEKLFLVAMTVCGITAGAAVAGVLMAIAVPATSPYLLTLAEKADVARLSGYLGWLTGTGMYLISLMALVVGIAALTLLLGVINPNIVSGAKNWRSRAGAKLAVSIAALIGWVAVLTAAIGGSSESQLIHQVIQVLVVASTTALLWFISGETGWAGIFSTSSWALPPPGERKRTLLLGAAVGLLAVALIGMVEWTQGKYFILVSEVLDRSGETSFLGYQLLAVGFIVMLGTAFPLCGWFVVALAPVTRAGTDVKQLLKGPAALYAIVAIMLLIGYGYAGRKYDLDKKDLAAVLSLPATAADSGTIVILHPDKEQPVTIQEGPRAVSGSGFSLQSTIGLSEENLKKVEAYLAAHPDGSVFTYAAREILFKGYHALWEVKNGLDWQVKAAGSQLIPRMLLLARFQVLPVTDENLRLLISFSDESVWSAGGRSALAIAKGYQHFGRTGDAKRWLDKARAAGAEGAMDDILKVPVVVDGAIHGRIIVNGAPPKGARVALLSTQAQRDAKEVIKISDLSLGKVLVDVKPLSPDGRFSFDRLGSGTYVVAVMTTREQIPAAVRSGARTVRPAPGPIRVGPERTKDLGTIEIVFKP